MKKTFTVFILVLVITLSASFESVVINPNSVRIGKISGFKKGDVLIPNMNYSSGTVFGNYLIPFGLSELSMQEVSYFGTISGISFLLSGTNFGNTEYRENTVAVAVSAYSAGELTIIPSLKFYNLKDALGNKISFGAGINTSYTVNEHLNTVLSVLNFYSYETDELDIPMTVCFNFEFIGPENFNLYSGIEKDSGNRAVFKTGLEYAPFTFFSVSAGYNFDPQLITSGFSIEYENFSFNYGMSYHFDLEYSHSFGLVYEF